MGPEEPAQNSWYPTVSSRIIDDENRAGAESIPIITELFSNQIQRLIPGNALPTMGCSSLGIEKAGRGVETFQIVMAVGTKEPPGDSMCGISPMLGNPSIFNGTDDPAGIGAIPCTRRSILPGRVA
jgi:hypothetical protein